MTKNRIGNLSQWKIWVDIKLEPEFIFIQKSGIDPVHLGWDGFELETGPFEIDLYRVKFFALF